MFSDLLSNAHDALAALVKLAVSTFPVPPLVYAAPDVAHELQLVLDKLPTPQARVVEMLAIRAGCVRSEQLRLHRSGHLFVLTLPRDRVVSDAGIDPTWADVADSLRDIDRPDPIAG